MNHLTSPLNFDNYTFRCSSVGKLMVKPRGKSPMQKYEECLSKILDLEAKPKLIVKQQESLTKLREAKQILYDNRNNIFLSTTAISYLLEIYCCVRDGIKKDITNKYIEKGIAVEDDAINLIAELHDELYGKNKVRLSNEFIQGECDVLYPESAPRIVIDNKSCWSRFQFQMHSLEKINQLEEDDEEETEQYGGDSTSGKINKIIYEYQGIGYCELFGVSIFKLVYTLMNMPEELIADEFARILWIYGKANANKEPYQLACAEFLKQCKFDHLPISERVIEFTVKQDSAKYTALVEQIKVARKWLNWYSIKEWERINKTKWIDPHENTHYHNHSPIDNRTEEEKNFNPKIIGTVVDEFGEITPEMFDILGSKITEPEEIEEVTPPDLQINPEFVFPNNLDDIKKEEPFINTTSINVGVVIEDEHSIKINSLASRQDCIDYFEENEEFLSENPEYYKLLDSKKKTFTTSVPATTQSKKTKAETQPTLEQKKVWIPPPTKVENPKQAEEDAAALSLLNYTSITESSQVKTLYRENMALIDRNLDFRNALTEFGQKLHKMEVEKIKEEINKEVGI